MSFAFLESSLPQAIASAPDKTTEHDLVTEIPTPVGLPNVAVKPRADVARALRPQRE